MNSHYERLLDSMERPASYPHDRLSPPDRHCAMLMNSEVITEGLPVSSERPPGQANNLQENIASSVSSENVQHSIGGVDYVNANQHEDFLHCAAPVDKMRSESSRLSSFQNLQCNLVGGTDWPSRLAQAGFFYTGVTDVLRCSSCGVLVSACAIRGDPFSYHAVSPVCQFASRRNVQMQNERCRLATFSSWPVGSVVSADQLAAAGLFYLGIADQVQCAFCQGVLHSWQPGDVPLQEHARLFPLCTFVRGNAPTTVRSLPAISAPSQETSTKSKSELSLSQRSSAMSQMSQEFTQTGSPPLPVHASHESRAVRLATFAKWPPRMHQPPELLADAGFYYHGYSDDVTCFWCDGSLRNWEPTDDPWVEHARWFPLCDYIRQVKGRAFIDTVKQMFSAMKTSPSSNEREAEPSSNAPVDAVYSQPSVPIERQTSSPIVSTSTTTTETSSTNTTNTLVNTSTTTTSEVSQFTSTSVSPSSNASKEKDVDLSSRFGEPKDTDIAAAAIAMGFSRDAIKQAISEKLASSGDTFTNVDELVGALVDLDIRTNTTSSPAEPTGTQPSSTQKGEMFSENQLVCKICMEADVTQAFMPCGHLVCCSSCAQSVKLCPICRADIRGTVRIFFS